MGIEGTADPFRADAALVWRWLREHQRGTVLQMAEACFPLDYGRDEPLYQRLMQGPRRRVLDSIVWMRHQGVLITCIPRDVDVDATTFVLGAAQIVESRIVRESRPVLDAVEDPWHPLQPQ